MQGLEITDPTIEESHQPIRSESAIVRVSATLPIHVKILEATVRRYVLRTPFWPGCTYLPSTRTPYLIKYGVRYF